MKYKVYVPCNSYYLYLIDAESKEKAIEKLLDENETPCEYNIDSTPRINEQDIIIEEHDHD